METALIAMDPEEAKRKLVACQYEDHADSVEFNQAAAEAYEELAAGRKLIHLGKSIRMAGLDENGRPRVAIAAADRSEVYFEWNIHQQSAAFYTKHRYTRGQMTPRLVREVDMGETAQTWIRGYALVPKVPGDVRPATGQLRDWFILWEVDEWFDRPRAMTAPSDPLLLKHIGGQLYSVLAEWDLTDVEKAIMEQLQ